MKPSPFLENENNPLPPPLEAREAAVAKKTPSDNSIPATPRPLQTEKPQKYASGSEEEDEPKTEDEGKSEIPLAPEKTTNPEKKSNPPAPEISVPKADGIKAFMFLGVLGAVLLSIFLVWLILEEKKAAEALSEYNSAISRQKVIREARKKLESSLMDNEKETSVIRAHILSNKDPVKLIETFEELGRRLPISFNIGNIKTEQNAVKASLYGRGNFSEVIRLVTALSFLPFQGEISSFELYAQDPGTETKMSSSLPTPFLSVKFPDRAFWNIFINMTFPF